MVTEQHNKKQNYYACIDGVKVLVDYTNERLKVLDYNLISENIVNNIINFAKDELLGKIISNCRIGLLKPFRNCGFEIEGIINGFFGGIDAYCISYFIDPQRRISSKKDDEDVILSQCLDNTKRFSLLEKQKYVIRDADVSDIPQMIKLFSMVFETYPSPVFNIEYLEKVMGENIVFKVVEEDGQIISIASADIDKWNLNAEITDCVTHPEYRGKGILPNIIHSLESTLKEKDLFTAYSLSRAINPGINKSLSRLEYKYCGRLVNNCHICGTYEDMNIWVKNLKI